MLGLMQILHFVMDAQTLPLAQEIFKLSQHETQARPSALSDLPAVLSTAWGKGSTKSSPSESGLGLFYCLTPSRGRILVPRKLRSPNQWQEPSSRCWLYSGNEIFSILLWRTRDLLSGSWLGAGLVHVKRAGGAGTEECGMKRGSEWSLVPLNLAFWSGIWLGLSWDISSA